MFSRHYVTFTQSKCTRRYLCFGTAEDFKTEVYYGGIVVPTVDMTLPSQIVAPYETDVYLNGKNLSAQGNILFYAPTTGAKLSINGEGTVTTATGYAGFATSNGVLVVNGGTFVSRNPMDSAFASSWTNPDGPALIVLADGYEMISETQENGDVWYMVVPVEQVQ